LRQFFVQHSRRETFDLNAKNRQTIKRRRFIGIAYAARKQHGKMIMLFLDGCFRLKSRFPPKTRELTKNKAGLFL
jgi:hypothetical protein